LKQILNFNDIATHELLKQFENKRVAIEIISLDSKELDFLQNKYLSYCYQIAAFLTESQGVKFYVKDAIFINSLKLKLNVIQKTDKDGNMLFIVNSKDFRFMNCEELQNLLQETSLYWSPILELH
jgi:hypothetical protein